MQRTFAILFVLIVLVVAVGFYRGWFSVTSNPGGEGRDVDVNFRVDKAQMKRDADEVKQETVDLVDRVKEQTSGSGATTTPDR